MNVNSDECVRQCTGCQLCAAVCPTSAIEIALDEDCFYKPLVNESKCVDCSLCTRVCYKFDRDICTEPCVETSTLYSAAVNDAGLLASTTSGGVADVLARHFISEGYVCVGVGYDCNSNIARGLCAETERDVMQFRGSKYIQSYSLDAFIELARGCRDKKFAVFGLPCQIYAVDRFLKRKGVRADHVLVDLYCHGCPSMLAWLKYIQKVKEETKAKKVLSVNFRSKVRGWGNFYVVVVVVVEGVDGPVEYVSPRIGDSFYELFFSDQILNRACSDCLLRSTLKYSDIRLGDFWGHRFVDNSKGVSAISVNSETGIKVFDKIRGELIYAQENYSDFLKYQSFGKIYRPNAEIRGKVLDSLRDSSQSIDDAVKVYHFALPLKVRIIRFAKGIVKMMPSSVISRIKNIFYKLFR